MKAGERTLRMGDAAAPELPQEEAPETPAFPPEAMSDATVVYKPLTYYEQSKPAYQTARRAQYEQGRSSSVRSVSA